MSHARHEPIHIRVLLFASLASQVGRRDLALRLPADASVDQAVARLAEAHPPIAAMRQQLATAVQQAYVKGDHVLTDGDELALIPPVSGG